MLPRQKEFPMRNDAKSYTTNREHAQQKSIMEDPRNKSRTQLLSLVCTDETCTWSCIFRLRTKQTVDMFCETSSVDTHSITCTSTVHYCSSKSLVDLSTNQERMYKEHLQKASDENKSKLLATTAGIIVDSAKRLIGSLVLARHNGKGDASTYTCTNLTCLKPVLDHGSTSCVSCIALVRSINKNSKRKPEDKESKAVKKLKLDNAKLKIQSDLKTKEKKALKRQLRAARVKLAKTTLKVQNFMSNSPGIYIKSLTEAKKWEAMCHLAYERCEREGGEDIDKRETLMALFKENMQNMGKFNKRGHKAGLRCRIDTRVMHLGITYANQMGQSGYESFRKMNPAFPSYSTIRKDLGKSETCVGLQHQNLTACRMRADKLENKDFMKVMAFSFDECICMKDIKYNMGGDVVGFNGTTTAQSIEATLMKEINFLEQNRLNDQAMDIVENNGDDDEDNDDDDDDDDDENILVTLARNEIAKTRKWVKVTRGTKFGWTVESRTEEVHEGDSESLIKSKEYLEVTSLDESGFAYKELKLNVGDKVFGYGTKDIKDTRFTCTEIINYIELGISNTKEDEKLKKDNLKKRQLEAGVGIKLKKISKAEKLLLDAQLKFKPYTICVMNTEIEDPTNMTNATNSANAAKATTALGAKTTVYNNRIGALMENYLATGYTQVRMVSLACPGFDDRIWDGVTKSMKSEEIEAIITFCIVQCFYYGFIIVAVICDGATANRKYYRNSFTLCDISQPKYPTYMLHPVTATRIYPIPDPSHAIKKKLASLGNSNHIIKYKGVLISLNSLHQLWLSFYNPNTPSPFGFKKSDFVKTNAQKMRVGPCFKVLASSKMLDMLTTAIIYSQKFKLTGKSKYKKWEHCEDLYTVYVEIVSKISSVYNILNRRRYPGLSTDPRHIAELDVFDDVFKWFIDWREDCFNNAQRLSRKVLTKKELYDNFFTEPASYDFIQILICVPQLVRNYAVLNVTSGKWLYIIPRHISEDNMENAFARYRFAIGHLRQTAETMLRAVKRDDNMRLIKMSIRNNIKNTNSGSLEAEIIDDPNVDKTTDEALAFDKADNITKQLLLPLDLIVQQQKIDQVAREEVVNKYELLFRSIDNETNN